MTKTRNELIAELVADPNSGPLREIGKQFGLTGPTVSRIAAKLGVARGPVQYPTRCSIAGCPRPHHAHGKCDAHYRRDRRAKATRRRRHME